ncbi:MAG TPA: PPK2 family polyphosphate kinase, partial [Myxococcales bacterium]|nr:PPK2 family polyphosphate kinase [Myxococcales bacterium]
RFTAPRKVKLAAISEEPPPDLSKGEAKDRFHALNDELFDLQDLMWGARTHSVLMILQGRDAAGKDGAVKHVVGALNPRGVLVTSFGVPTQEEREHDFLWRVHRHAPRLGEFAIFNRSHYEDVLVVRVKGLVPARVWKERYALIDAFERTLAAANCIVLKYFLHITRDEQKERLLEREKDPNNAWKLNVEDWKEREMWDDFTEAYEDAIGKCASRDAPWIVVPANAKWYRNLVIAESLAAALRPHRKEWRETLDQEGKIGRRDIKEWRAAQRASRRSPSAPRAK